MVKTLALYLTLSRFSSKSLLWHIRPKAINIIWSLLTLQPSALNFLQFKIYTLGQAELLPVPSGLDLCVFFAVSITVYLFFFFFSDSYPIPPDSSPCLSFVSLLTLGTFPTSLSLTWLIQISAQMSSWEDFSRFGSSYMTLCFYPPHHSAPQTLLKQPLFLMVSVPH